LFKCSCKIFSFIFINLKNQRWRKTKPSILSREKSSLLLSTFKSNTPDMKEFSRELRTVKSSPDSLLNHQDIFMSGTVRLPSLTSIMLKCIMER